VNCCVAPSRTLCEDGVTLTVIVGGGGGGAGFPPPQPTETSIAVTVITKVGREIHIMHLLLHLNVGVAKRARMT